MDNLQKVINQYNAEGDMIASAYKMAGIAYKMADSAWNEIVAIRHYNEEIRSTLETITQHLDAIDAQLRDMHYDEEAIEKEFNRKYNIKEDN